MHWDSSKIRNILFNPLTVVVIVAVLVAGLYMPALNGDFLFDDGDNIVENPVIKSLDYFVTPSKAAGTKKYEDFKRRYIGYLSLAANYLVGGLNTTGYHAVNILIHMANGLLVYALVLLTFKTPFLRRSSVSERSHVVAFLAALIFIVHPVQTQAVSYIIQRLTSLATLFYLAAVVCYLSFRLTEKKNRRILFYILSIVMAVLGMKTKEIAFTLPFTVLMCELFFFTGPLKKRVSWWLPIGLTLLIIPLTIINFSGLESLNTQDLDKSLRIRTMSRDHFLLTEFRVLVTYLRLVALPFNQNIDYQYPVFRSFREPAVWTSFALLSILAAAGAYLFMRSKRSNPALRIVSFGIAWFFISISVESTLVPLFVIFEHRVYLPMAGVSSGAAAGAVLLYSSLKRPTLRRAALALVVAVPLSLATLTFTRNFTWQSEISLWEDVVAKSPNKSRGHVNLGKAYRVAGMEDKAMEQFKASLQARDFEDYVTRVQAFIDIGNHYYDKGDNARAIEFYRRSIDINPEYELGYFNLATVYISEGKADEALLELDRAIEMNPGFAPAYYLRGEAFMKQDKTAEAVTSYKRALELNPELAKARMGLAGALGKLGMQEESLLQYRQSVHDMPESADAHYLLGNALREAGDFDGAGNSWKKAVELDPEHAGALNHLGGYYLLKKNYPTAVEYIVVSLKYDESNAEAHYNLALALEKLGRWEEAVGHYRRFIELASSEYADVVERIKQRINQ